MPELGELVAFMVELDEKEKCNYKPETNNWRANLDGSSTRLELALGNKPHANNESELSSSNWPSQAHHLIPHLTLKAHAVADCLKKDNKIYEDTKYDVDHQNNGKWMPYASSLPEWSTGTPTQQRALMFKIMRLAKIQMHQGPHSGKNNYGIGIKPYKKRVIDYLDAIDNHAVSHYADAHKCKDCNSKKFANKYPPRENTVQYVDKASSLLDKDNLNIEVELQNPFSYFSVTLGY